MDTECKPKQLEFQSLGRREVIGRFDGGRITSDGGGLLLREVDRCREAIMAWCEANDVGYVLGLARNKRLERALGKEMETARVACERTGEAARRFGDFRYRTRKSWSCERRVIGKAEYLPGKANPRFVVTNLSTHEVGAQRLYEELYFYFVIFPTPAGGKQPRRPVFVGVVHE